MACRRNRCRAKQADVIDNRDSFALRDSLTVAIDARMPHGEAGGVESVIIGLAEGLSSLEGSEDYVFLTLRGADDWIRPHLRGCARAVAVPSRMRRRLQEVRAGVEQRIPGVERIYRRIRAAATGIVDGPPPSDGTIERLGVDVMHFTAQGGGFLTSIPSIYHPHDLQHRHLPQLFSPEERAHRDLWYSTLCDQATLVAVASSWTRDDVIAELGLAPDKVRVVPWAPPLGVFHTPSKAEQARVAARLRLPERFVLYPAQTWPHKNHEGLVEALHIIRQQRGFTIPLVLTGRRNAGSAAVDACIDRLAMREQIAWTGFVEPDVLAAIFRLATAVVIPSRFEAASGPLWEAFAAGTPAACSNATSLPDQAGDAALLFDPDEPRQIADAVMRLWTDEELRRTLSERGVARVAAFTWDRTGRMFRAHYRRLGGRTLTDEDFALIGAKPWL